jgi:hypothetical protein
MATDDYNSELGEEFDEFRVTTGLKDDFDGIITDAYFGKPQSGGENLMLFVKVTADDGDEVENRYGLGKSWVSYDGGKTVEHPTDKYFNNRTAYAEMFAAAVKCGAKEELGRRSKELERRGPKDSRLWVGLKFHWLVKQESFQVPQRDEAGQEVRSETGVRLMTEVTSNRVLPTKWLGTDADQAPAKPKATRAKKETTTTTEAPTDAPAAESNGGGTSALMAKVKVLARTQPFETWVDKVMDLPGALDDDDLVSQLTETYYEELQA